MAEKIKYKNGSIGIIFICFIFIIFISIFFYIFFLNYKINIKVYRIKQDIDNIVQNVILSFNQEELSYNNYIINEEDMIYRVGKIMELSYKEASLEYLSYNKEDNEVNIVVSVNIDNENKVCIKHKVKVKLMQVNSYN